MPKLLRRSHQQRRAGIDALQPPPAPSARAPLKNASFRAPSVFTVNETILSAKTAQVTGTRKIHFPSWSVRGAMGSWGIYSRSEPFCFVQHRSDRDSTVHGSQEPGVDEAVPAPQRGKAQGGNRDDREDGGTAPEDSRGRWIGFCHIFVTVLVYTVETHWRP